MTLLLKRKWPLCRTGFLPLAFLPFKSYLGNTLLKDCFPKGNFLFLLVEGFSTTWNNFLYKTDINNCSFDQAHIEIKNYYISFRLSSPFLSWASFISLFTLQTYVLHCFHKYFTLHSSYFTYTANR